MPDAFERDLLANCCPRIGVPAADPSNQNSSTGYFRIFAQSTDAQALVAITSAIRDISLKHFSGWPAKSLSLPQVHFADKYNRFP